MKSNPFAISRPILITIISFIFTFVFCFDYNTSYSIENVTKESGITLNSISENPKVLLNTTNLTDCLYSYQLENNSSNFLILKYHDLKSNETVKADNYPNKMCKIVNVSGDNSCFEYFTNQSTVSCDLQDSNDTVLSIDNFNSDGLLIMDTKFNNSYNFEIIDPLNSGQIIGVNLDLDKHTQTNNDDINSPRIEIVRKDDSGMPNMSAAKNQVIIWEGEIKDFFKEPLNQYQNETYISIQFNTGRHGSNIANEERGFGVLFDVSSSSNPYLFEYLDDGKYTKYNYESIKQLAGNDFVFHNVDVNNNPIFLNNLTNSEEVKLKVLTRLSSLDNSTRMVETFVDNGKGVVLPYWSLNDLSKLKNHDRITSDDEFMETLYQGSGYTIARTDNIDTRLLAFHSFVFGF